MMNLRKTFPGFLAAASISLVPALVLPTALVVPAQMAWAQTQNSQVQKLQSLLQESARRMEQGQHKQAIVTFQQALKIAH